MNVSENYNALQRGLHFVRKIRESSPHKRHKFFIKESLLNYEDSSYN
mgnify:FL=1